MNILEHLYKMEKVNSKNYYEELAKETLKNFVDIIFGCLKIIDRPDLQSEAIGWGIEVRECKDDYEGRYDYYIRHYFKKNNAISFLIENARKLHLKPLINLDSKTGIIISAFSEEMSDMECKKRKIVEYIEEKNKKTKKYKKFKNNGLYLFCKWTYEEIDVKGIIDKLSSINFSHLFFDCMDCIYVFNVEKNNLQKISFDMEIYKKTIKTLKSKYKKIFE